MNTPTTGYTLEHALLYCIGVNLPSHRVGQLDRVLVLASPITDVNMQAWNLNRLTGFHVIEAGIQMVLCPFCMGHRKNIITFLLPPHFKKECIEFLLREVHVQEIVRKVSPGPIYHYVVPHHCRASPAPGYPAPTQTPASYPPVSASERVAISLPSDSETHEFLPPSYANIAQWHNTRDGHNVSVTSTQVSGCVKRKPPPIPPRDIPRPEPQPYLQCRTEVHHHHRLQTVNSRSHTFAATPYSISHRVFIDADGHVRRESRVLGSGSGEFRLGSPMGTSPLLTPPRSTPACNQDVENPLYRNLPSRNMPTGASCPASVVRNRLAQTSSDTGATGLERVSHQSSMRRRSDSETVVSRAEWGLSAIHPCLSFPTSRHSQEIQPHSYSHSTASSDSSAEFTRKSESCDYQNLPQVLERSPSPCMCTDDISDATFAMRTTLRLGPLPTPPRAAPPDANCSHDATQFTVGEKSYESPDYRNLPTMTEASARQMAADYQNTGAFVKPPIPIPRRRYTMETEVFLVPTAMGTLSISDRQSPDSSQSNVSSRQSPDLPEQPSSSLNDTLPVTHSPSTLQKPAPPHRYFSNSAENSPVFPRRHKHLENSRSHSSTSLSNSGNSN